MNKTFLNIDAGDDLLASCDGLLVRPLYNRSHLKLASTGARSILEDHMPDDDHFGIHLVAMGASERYGFNRNGDYWEEKELQDRHPTFVKYAGFYQEHKHHDPSLSRGPVKFSFYNKPMDRVELVLWGNKDKAPKTWEAVKAGNALAFSMAASVPHDVCSICSHQAPTPDFYCEHAANHMTQYLPSHRKFAFVTNPRPTFFDISEVAYPADRIAWWLAYAPNADEGQGMLKAASVGSGVVPSAKIASMLGIKPPENMEDTGWSEARGLGMLQKLAAAEEQIERSCRGEQTSADFDAMVKHAHGKCYDMAAGSDELLDALRKLAPEVAFGLLKQAGMMLPLRMFYGYVSGKPLAEVDNDPIYLTAAKQASTMYRDRMGKAVNAELEGMFTPASNFKVACSCNTGDPVQALMDKVGQEFESTPQKAKVRVLRISMRPQQILKMATAVSDTEKVHAAGLLDTFCHYKLASLLAMESPDELIDSDFGRLLLCNH